MRSFARKVTYSPSFDVNRSTSKVASSDATDFTCKACMKLKGKVAVVTGSGRGIGRAIAIALAKEGAKVAVDCLHHENAEAVAKEIRKHGGEALAISGDVSSAKDVRKIFDSVVKKFSRIDILVNNAGIVHMDPLLDLKEEQWDAILDTNLKGCFLCSQAAARIMTKQKNGVKPTSKSASKPYITGKIINISSIAGKIGFPQLAHYCASKGGIIELTREMALELAPNITVNAIGPGVIETDMTKDLLADKNARENFLQSIPLGRVGKPEDIAAVAVFLASSGADYITGQTIYVDGGWITK